MQDVNYLKVYAAQILQYFKSNYTDTYMDVYSVYFRMQDNKYIKLKMCSFDSDGASNTQVNEQLGLSNKHNGLKTEYLPSKHGGVEEYGSRKWKYLSNVQVPQNVQRTCISVLKTKAKNKYFKLHPAFSLIMAQTQRYDQYRTQQEKIEPGNLQMMYLCLGC